jgi:hypothetical protein
MVTAAARYKPDHRCIVQSLLFRLKAKRAAGRSAAGRVEIRIVTADPCAIHVVLGDPVIGARARRNERRSLHLVIGAAIMPESVGRLLGGGSVNVLGEDRARYRYRREGDNAKCSNIHGVFHLYVVNPSSDCFLPASPVTSETH